MRSGGIQGGGLGGWPPPFGEAEITKIAKFGAKDRITYNILMYSLVADCISHPPLKILDPRQAFYFWTLGSLSTRVSETRTATGSELFSLLTCPHTTTFILLRIFSPLEISGIKIWETIRS